MQGGSLEQQLDLRAIEVSRQVLVEFWTAHAASRIGVHDLVAVHVGIEAPHGGECARDRALAELPAVQVREKPAEREAVDSLPRPVTLAVVGGKKLQQPGEVAAVSLESVRRNIPLLLHVKEKVFHLLRLRYQPASVRTGGEIEFSLAHTALITWPRYA